LLPQVAISGVLTVRTGRFPEKPEEVEHLELFPEGVVREAKKEKNPFHSIHLF